MSTVSHEIKKRRIRLEWVKAVNVSDKTFLERTDYRNMYVVKAIYNGSPVYLSVLAYTEPTLEEAIVYAFEQAQLMWYNYQGLYLLFKARFGAVASLVSIGAIEDEETLEPEALLASSGAVDVPW